MTAHTVSVLMAHWFFVGFFILFGLHLMTRRKYFLSVRDAARYSSLSRASERDEALRAAIDRRAEAEGAPRPVGLWAGAICIALGVAAIFTASPMLLYGIMCFALATLTAAAYIRLKNTQRLRTAVLAPRSPASVIPPYWFVVAAGLAISVLAFVTLPQEALPSILVCCAALASSFFSWRLTQLPAILSGVDVAAEQRVDEKLRFVRSSVPMVFALVQTAVFAMQAGRVDLNALQTAVFFLNLIGWIAFFIWIRIPDKPAAAVPAQ
jgi:hypothetical protein